MPVTSVFKTSIATAGGQVSSAPTSTGSGGTKLFSSGQACTEDVAPTEPLAGLSLAGQASLMATRCSGAAAATSLQEGGVMCGHDQRQVWLTVGRGKEISYLEHLLWATEDMYGGDLQREEGRAAARRFSPPSVILQNIYLALCKLTLLLPQKQPQNCLETSPYCLCQTV